MYNIIIYNNNLEFAKNVCNNIICNFSNSQLLGISTNESELIFLLSKNSSINTIFISEEDIKNPKISSIIHNIKNKIIICADPTKYKNSKHNIYISQTFDLISTQKNLNNFIHNIDTINMRKKVFKILKDLNFDFKLNGTNYLLDAITYSHTTKNKYLFENLEKNIYPQIAKKYKVSTSNIKWSIIRSVNNMNNCHSEFSEKVTPKYLISNIINSI